MSAHWAIIRRRFLLSILVGTFLTGLTVVARVRIYLPLRVTFGSTTSVSDDVDESYWEGWIERADGSIRLIRERVGVPSMAVGSLQADLQDASRNDRPWQLMLYGHMVRGAPLLCCELFWATGAPHGSNGNVPQGDLRRYPEFRFGRLRPLACAANVAIWTAVVLIPQVVAGRLRRWHRNRRGRCVRCGYDLRLLSGERCPECGWAFEHTRCQNTAKVSGKADRTREGVTH